MTTDRPTPSPYEWSETVPPTVRMPRRTEADFLHAEVCKCFGHDRAPAEGECPNRLRIARAICPAPALHQVEDAPLQKLADLLRTATEFDEIADLLVFDRYDLSIQGRERIDALRAAVRALNETGGA